MVLFQNFQNKQKKSNARIEMYIWLIINSVPNNFVMDSPIARMRKDHLSWVFKENQKI